jgi:hypothetical protein
MKDTRLITLIIGLILFIISCYLIWVYGGWQLFLGIFLWTAANNIGQRYQ